MTTRTTRHWLTILVAMTPSRLHCSGSDDETTKTADAGSDASTAGSGGGGAVAGTGGGGVAGSGGVAGGAGTPGPAGAGGTWTLVWADEFDGTSLDLKKWLPNWFGGSNTALTKPINDLEVRPGAAPPPLIRGSDVRPGAAPPPLIRGSIACGALRDAGRAALTTSAPADWR